MGLVLTLRLKRTAQDSSPVFKSEGNQQRPTLHGQQQQSDQWVGPSALVAFCWGMRSVVAAECARSVPQAPGTPTPDGAIAERLAHLNRTTAIVDSGYAAFISAHTQLSTIAPMERR